MTTDVMPRFDAVIDGASYRGPDARYDPVCNPATGEVVGEMLLGTAADLDLAVASARRAVNDPNWRSMPVQERSRLLYRCAELILANAQELTELEVSSSGGTVARISAMDVPGSAVFFMNMAELVLRYPFCQALAAPLVPEALHTQIVKQPVGVCGLITAWNFPLLLLAMKLAPALAAGNSVIIKPAEITPSSSVRLAELFQGVLPPGVLNIVPGAGNVVGEAMSLHPGIDKISFTGSTLTGKRIMRNAAETVKRVTLELGGKSAGIVLPDADLSRTASGALFASMMNAGQVCTAGTRLLVHRDVYEPLLQHLADAVRQCVVGNPTDENARVGPLSSKQHFEKVMSYIESARKEGARILAGGNRVLVPGSEGGFYIEPTIVVDATNEMQAARNEIFGPVLCVIPYDTVEEAIDLANDSNYGLAAGIWTEDQVAAQAIALQLDAGSVWINDWHMTRLDAPFGGLKQSGIGREISESGLEAYLETRTVTASFERDLGRKLAYDLVLSPPAPGDTATSAAG